MTTKLADAQNYLDLNGLNSIRQQSNSDDKASKEQALETAAKQFEAIFMQMLLKSMRKAEEVLESDSPFNSESTKFYRDMHDQQMSLELSNNGSLGLSELIVRQLGGDSEKFTPKSHFKANVFQGNEEQIKKNDLHLPNRRQFPDYVTVKSVGESTKTSTEPFNFTEPRDFVTALTEPAKQVEKKLNIPFEVVIAQAALETGWGQKVIKTEQGESSNNLFNIKADSRWAGEKTHKETLEYEQGAMVKKREPFRVYQNIGESINDYINFLSKNERYQGALQQVGNVEQFLHNLQGAGYATDPNYANKIMGTLQTVTSLIKK
ncbi:flagellar assembly peptidoglycan hydrolase FlgJ [Colwellia sp. 1_MG-2023]|uniref:flagellar assembly peptidoglycan hydrolase FlgJ n=1 Tax=Colwellia sp. 1_MG-2023 TaxID=3062649 RepID=UPI0026E165BC|nr:flagellar assembly peptidoglycan hydrolase FlgJ [Colwellia sp. 1_MG-2023]MDO6444407.1 flagellar assembly peptidoglycan hydrolase FlgJ [Colwellia sp. 1_MG-2023]